MSRPVQVGDLVTLTLDEESSTYLIQKIVEPYIYISPSDQPDALFLLYPDSTGRYVIEANEETPYQVTFTGAPILTGDHNVDIQLLTRLNDQLLTAVCDSNDYARQLCQRDYLWESKIRNRFGERYLQYRLLATTLPDYYNLLLFLAPYYDEQGQMTTAAVQMAIDGNHKGIFDYLYHNYPEVVDRYYTETSGPENIRRLRQRFPQIFPLGYDRLCQVPPRIYTEAEESYWRDHPAMVEGQAIPREILPFPTNNPEVYLISPGDDYPYVRLKQILIPANRDQYPCSSKYPAVRPQEGVPRTWEEARDNLDRISPQRSTLTSNYFMMFQLMTLARNLGLSPFGSKGELANRLRTAIQEHFNE